MWDDVAVCFAAAHAGTTCSDLLLPDTILLCCVLLLLLLLFTARCCNSYRRGCSPSGRPPDHNCSGLAASRIKSHASARTDKGTTHDNYDMDHMCAMMTICFVTANILCVALKTRQAYPCTDLRVPPRKRSAAAAGRSRARCGKQGSLLSTIGNQAQHRAVVYRQPFHGQVLLPTIP